MNGKSYQMPVGMRFKKFYCAKCATKLEREQTHRVVTEADKDYFRYQSYNRFPRVNFDVYHYRFRCPGCEARNTYEDQCVLDGIQKRCGHWILTPDEIRENYEAGKKARAQHVLLTSVLVAVGCALLSFIFYSISRAGERTEFFTGFAMISLLGAIFAALRALARHNGSYQTRFKEGYSYETETRLQKLHTYATANKELVETAENCYCFRCRKVTESRKIKRYAEDGKTALCPHCGTAALLPDSIEEVLDQQTVSLMYEYWF